MVPFLRRLCAFTTFLPCAHGVWTFVNFALSAECTGWVLWSWLFLGFVRQCYELSPDVLVTFLVALAAVILFGTGDCFPFWLFLGFARRCYELEPDVLVTFGPFTDNGGKSCFLEVTKHVFYPQIWYFCWLFFAKVGKWCTCTCNLRICTKVIFWTKSAFWQVTV